jgi:glucose-1-phosphate cytidylyltransferase
MFLANYSDGLSDLNLDELVRQVKGSKAVAGFVSIRSPQSFHTVQAEADGTVTAISAMNTSDLWLNGGFFVLRRQIFDHLNEGEELVEKPFARLAAQRLLVTHRHQGFWQAMDTFKDKILFDRMEAQGQCPWMVWQQHPAGAPGR